MIPVGCLHIQNIDLSESLMFESCFSTFLPMHYASKQPRVSTGGAHSVEGDYFY